MRYSLLTLLACLAMPLAMAQPRASCSSDAQPKPTVLVERFLNADCASCWAEPPAVPATGRDALVLDWIVPGTQGEDAPLSAAATPDALERLRSLGREVPQRSDTFVSSLPTLPTTALLRVAHGPAVADYVGAHLRFIPPHGKTPRRLQVTLLMLEEIPPGTEGSPVTRHLVRNVFRGVWDARGQRPPTGAGRLAGDTPHAHTPRSAARAPAHGGLGAGRWRRLGRRRTHLLRHGSLKRRQRGG